MSRSEPTPERLGVDRQTVEDFERDLRKNLKQLSEQWIDKLGSQEKRPLGIPTVRDRVVQAASRLVLEPIFERDFAEAFYVHPQSSFPSVPRGPLCSGLSG